MMRAINEIARDIRADWKNLSPYAKPYLDAMFALEGIRDNYYEDSAQSVVLYFLANAQTWRGPVAKAIKAELKALMK